MASRKVTPEFEGIDLTRSLIAACFSKHSFDRGDAYQREGSVLDVHFERANRLASSVAGTQHEPYRQVIDLDAKNGRLLVDGRCTCPVGWNCKHVAAALLELVEHPENVAGMNVERESASSTVPSAVNPVPRDPALDLWLNNLAADLAPDTYADEAGQRLFYVISQPTSSQGRTVVELMYATVLKDGGVGKPARMGYSSFRSGILPRYVLPSDGRLIERMERALMHERYDQPIFRLSGANSGILLESMLATGRARWNEAGGMPLRTGAPRPAQLRWSENSNGAQSLTMSVDNGALLPTQPPYYIDLATGECGVAEIDLPEHVLQTLLQAPSVRPENAMDVRETLARLLPDHPEILPIPKLAPEIRQIEPLPVLTVESQACTYQVTNYRMREPSKHLLPMARLEFDYEGTRVRADVAGNEIRCREGDRTLIYPRQHAFETRQTSRLLARGWTYGQNAVGWKMPPRRANDYVILPAPGTQPDDVSVRQRYLEFVAVVVPQLREEGWQVNIADGLTPAREEVTWQIQAHDDGHSDWFALDLGILVDGERVDLRPILAQAILTLARTGGGRMQDVSDKTILYHQLPNGTVVPLPVSRIRPLVQALTELFGPSMDWGDELRIPLARAGDISELDVLADEAGFRWHAPDRLREMSDRLKTFEGITPVEPPAELQGDLRPYQKEGLSWLQFLREYGFGGVLADDMGLGKTVQTLSHILTEKAAGRLEHPALIVAPTSTLPNWRREAERFAPSLKVLVLHGSQRSADFPRLDQFDLILTSFPLLNRDRTTHTARRYHLVVLDEAQAIKNPAAAVTGVVGALQANHRICLTGTPVENNLEELWSLFNFLMPGFLEGITKFRRTFRVPIEQHNDPFAKSRLLRMIRPFILRRTKEQVAKELPPKQEIVERIELSGGQRDLYESLRLAMDKRVRDLIASQGFAKSHIQILDALLKLRQACCDPRLVKLDTAKEVKGSAKLERLIEMLEEFQESGRRVLIFSQFTSMLDLIEEALRTRGWEWVRISGDTKDRETPVQRFQAGEVPIFLISLKAGGTGLNLTAADTVIHYDPWWNPAVERQATDRAHRIGQAKSVFVFKLVAAGTVEEKILDLQARKAQLAGAILDEDADPIETLTAEDLNWIFEVKEPAK